MEKLLWETKFQNNFDDEYDFLETILKSYDIQDVKSFLHPVKNKVIDNGKDSNQELRNAKYKIMELENKLIDKLLKGKLKNMEPLKQKAYLYRRGFRTSNY